ncbi:MAG TPA: heme ABC exporter ATP-binding protein CcmA [Rhizomicrobium sp.]|jgi:heme exporter protein A|nr:heme ABC exporter ATP-binding protein CcmA [Rhizomicrobium sp.]
MITSLTAEKLTCARGERRLFDGLSFTVKAGQALAVEGANGAGKTSLLRLLAGFLAPVAGRVVTRQGGRDSDDAEMRGRLVGWLGHQDGLKPQLTVREQLVFYAALYGQRADTAMLEQVGLARQADLPCRYLSAGQRRRLALARLLVSQRPLWLLDEPFAALDTSGQALVAQMMVRHCGAGGIIIAAAHEPLGLSNESLVLSGGGL